MACLGIYVRYDRVITKPCSLWPSQATSAAKAMKSARAHVEDCHPPWQQAMDVCMHKICHVIIRQSNMAIIQLMDKDCNDYKVQVACILAMFDSRMIAI